VNEKQPDADLEQLVEQFCKTAMSISDVQVRRHFVAARLVEMDDVQIAEVLHRLSLRAMQGDKHCRGVFSSALDAQLLSRQLGKLRVGRIFHEANRKKYEQVCNLFRMIKPAKDDAGDENFFFQYGLHTLTLGERKSAARSLDRDVLNRVGYDLDPAVIRQLLRNPRLTEVDVITIAARRPNSPEVLEEIGRAPKWASRQAVRIALVRNPYTPPRVAISLIPMLLVQDLRDVIFDSNIHQEVRASAQRAYEIKKGKTGETPKEASADT